MWAWKSPYSEDDYVYSTDDNAPEFTDFGFGFDNPNFSDRVLRLEVLPDPPVDELRKLTKEEETPSSAEEDAEPNSRSPSSLSSSCKVTTFHISSLILAAKSPVFLKMFAESEQKTVTISVHASEEKALLDLIGFLYKGTLSPKTSYEVLDVLKFADLYQVTSCAKYCRRLMWEYPMTLELALAYEELPARIFAGVSFETPMREATRFLNDIERNISTHEDALKLPLDRVKNVLSSKEHKFDSEDEVFDFALKWVTANYDDLSNRSEVFCSKICPLIRFPFMSDAKLNEALQRAELNQANAAKMVAEALLDKAGNLHTPRALNLTQCSSRAHKLIPVKVAYFSSPCPGSIVCFAVSEGDILDRRNCDKKYTQPFRVGREWFQVTISRTEATKVSRGLMTAALIRKPGGSPSGVVEVEYEFAVRSWITDEYVNTEVRAFVIEGSGLYHLPEYIVPLDCSEYSIDGVVYFRVRVTAAILLY